jgi:integrase
MASIKVPYLVVKPGRAGGLRYFWQPAAALRSLGWRPQRIPDNWQAFAGAELEAQAIARAKALNGELEAWRKGEAPATAPAAVARKGQPVPGSLAAVIGSYKLSRFFTTKAEGTRRVYLQSLGILERWGGALPARAITPKAVQEFYELAYAKAPGVANNAVRVLRIVMEHARRENLVAINPAVKPGLIGLAPSGRIWPLPAIELFVRKADELGKFSVGTAIMLNEWLGQREGDVLQFRRSLLRNGELVLRQNKTGAGVKLPLGMVERLRIRLEEEMKRQAAREVTATTLIVNEATGKPYTLASFGRDFAAVREAAAAEVKAFAVDYLVAGADAEAELEIKTAELVFRHLRHTAVVRLAEAGCEVPLISAITGHTIQSVQQILERYLVRTGEMARQAFAKRLAKEKADA